MKTARFLGQLAFLKVAHPRALLSTVRPCLFSSVRVDTTIVEGASCLKWRGGSTRNGQYCKTSSFPRKRESSDSIQMPWEKSMKTDTIGGFVFDFLRPSMFLGLYQSSLTILILLLPLSSAAFGYLSTRDTHQYLKEWLLLGLTGRSQVI